MSDTIDDAIATPAPQSAAPRRARHAHKPTRRASLRSGARLGAQICAALLSLTLVVGTGIAWSLVRDLQSSVPSVHVSFGSGDTTDGPVGPLQDVDGKDQNILLIGDDSREGATEEELAELRTEYDAGNNTDTIMLLHAPADGSSASIISFPRDSYVDVPGHGMQKINAAYALGYQATGTIAGGIELLAAVISNLTGLTIDHFAKVGLLAFMRISKAIGGVEVNLCNPVYDEDSGADFPAGVQQISGGDAVAFVRQRHGLPDGDLDRVVRQQVFLSSAFRQIVSAGTLLNLSRVRELIDAVASSMVKDDGLDLLKFAQQMSSVTSGGLATATIPVAGTPTITVNGAPLSIVQLDTAAIPQFITDLIGQPTEYNKAQPVPVSMVAVKIIDDTSAGGALDASVQALQAAGFTVIPGRSADVRATTAIAYPPGMEPQAKTLAQYVPNAQVIRSTAATELTLLLGDDGLGAVSSPTSASPTPTGQSTSGSPNPAPSAVNRASVTGPQTSASPAQSPPSLSSPSLSSPSAASSAPAFVAAAAPTPTESGVRTSDETSCIN